MKRTMLTVGMVTLCAMALWVGQVRSQEGDKESSKDVDASQVQEMMKKYIEAMTPSEHHKRLEHFVGQWDMTYRMWMMGPDAPPSETRATSTAKWVLGGRFILDETKGKMFGPTPEGGFGLVDFEGIGLTGYENFNERYVTSWADSLNTHLLSMTGSYDEATKTFTYEGDMAEPMMGIKARKVRFVTRITGPDSHVLEVYDLHAGPGYKAFEVVYQRKQE